MGAWKETLGFAAMPGLEASRAPRDSAALNFCWFFELILTLGILLAQLHIGSSTGSAPARPWHSYQNVHISAAITKGSPGVWLRAQHQVGFIKAMLLWASLGWRIISALLLKVWPRDQQHCHLVANLKCRVLGPIPD